MMAKYITRFLLTEINRYNLSDDIEDWIITTNSVIMDGYLLSRMFRKFSKNQKHIDSKRVIIFVGDYHIRRYVRFFKQFLGVNQKHIKEYTPNLGITIDIDTYDHVIRCVKVREEDFE